MDSHISHGLYVTVSVTVISLREAAASKSGNVARGVQARDRDRGANPRDRGVEARDRGETEASKPETEARLRRGVGTPRGGLETEALRPRPQPWCKRTRHFRYKTWGKRKYSELARKLLFLLCVKIIHWLPFDWHYIMYCSTLYYFIFLNFL